MEIDNNEAATYEQRMLEHATRQTKAQESLRDMAFAWGIVAAVGIAIWLIVIVAS